MSWRNSIAGSRHGWYRFFAQARGRAGDTATWPSGGSGSLAAPDPVRSRPREGSALPGAPSLAGVRDCDGRALAEYRRTLPPHYARAWVDLLGRWALVFGG